MNTLSSMFASNPMGIYLVGMLFVVILAVMFCLSIYYYIRAKDLVPYIHKIKELTGKISELQHKVEDVETQLKEKIAEVTHAERLIQQGKDAMEWLKAHKEEIETTQKILEKVRTEIETVKVQKTDLDRQISERQQQLVVLEKKAVEAEGKVKEAENAVEDIRKENAELTTRVPALRAERDALTNDIQAQRERIAEVSQKIQEQMDLLNRAKGELEKLTGLIAAKRAELEAFQQSLEKVQVQVSEKARELAGLEARAGVAQKALTKLAAQREESGEKWKNLDTPIVSEKLMRDVGKELEERLWLKEFEDRLQGNGFVFDGRAIRAFHTGLKCARQTPLVVLAGISGTGKSLLPELYASALGMNFLSVPVQPRWDSPQDLFGFYNYMEGRYKATELARLLWQFDRYNNPSAKKKFTEKNLPLNLVLLDEMNLARVEYYFSDLLSKLETRNGLDADAILERQKAEIELECNAADKVDSMRHLFVSPYTLFVGTMNEDESTQALSDKVIDRANVLRFGRPKMLGDTNGQVVQEPNKSGFIATYAADSRVSAEMWNGWCRGLEDAKEETDGLAFLRKTVAPVVEALDKVYRSYGFRVDKAMKLYVMNYPGSYKEAVADQIEMKILPKLNGVELQEDHFDEVKAAMLAAIDATGDEKLKTAFIDACPEGGTFFKWRGVMR